MLSPYQSMTQVKINGEEIPKDTINHVLFELGGGAFVQGEAINEDDRTELSSVLDKYEDGEVVEFFAENKDFANLRGAGKILAIKKDEEAVGKLIRIKYSFKLQYLK